MLNFQPKTRQKRLCRIHAHGQWHGKHVRLRLTTQAVAGHAAHGQLGQNYGNAEVIRHREPVFDL